MHGVLTAPAVWYLMRSTGVVALLLLTLVVALGAATSMRWQLAGQSRAVTVGLHRSVSLLAVVFVAVHVLTAVVDPDAAVQLASVLVPFAGSARPFWVGLGAVATELVAALVVTSLLRRHFSNRVWHGVHWLAYVAWPVALLHGIGMGSDTATSWMTFVDVACVGVVGAAATWRVLTAAEASTAARPSSQATRT